MKRNMIFIRSLTVLFILSSILTAGMASPAAAQAQTANLKRIRFASGATWATVRGELPAWSSVRYVLRAGAGQLMDISVSPANSVQLILYGVDGTVLRSGMGEGSSWRGVIPSSQDYIIALRSGGQDVSYTMKVIIPRRISFKRGAVSASLKGNLRANQSQYFVLRALKGQTLEVNLTPRHNVQLTVTGANSGVLPSVRGPRSNYRARLPFTQDYILLLKAGGSPVSYSLKVTVR
jgi:hypothetical protein